MATKSASSKAQQLQTRAERSRDTVLLEAVETWIALDRESQRRLTAEIVQSRADEIRRAYSAVVGVGFGYRTRGRWTTKGGDRRVVTNEPCVVFMITRKWRQKPKSRAALARQIPDHLLAFCDAGAGTTRTRRLCAVPVDVIERTDHAASPQNGVRAGRSTCKDPAGVRPDCGGSFAALVVPRSGGPTYAVTCHHFAAMSNGYLGIPVQAATFSLVDDPGAGTFGELSAHIGRIVPPGAASLDVALVEVRPDMLDVARRAVGPHRPMNVLPATDLPPEEVLIVASRNEAPIRARFVIAHKDFNGIDYFPRGHLQPRHDVVWEFLGLDSGQTVGGDSGCAVINGRGDTLLAMHVAGGKGTSRTGGRSFAIPIRFAIYGPNIGLQDFLDPIA